MNKNKKAQRVTTEGLSRNQNQINAGGIEKHFDVFNYAENGNEKQCQKCNPPLHKPSGAMKFCQNCEAEAEQTAQTFFSNFKKHRTIKKLDCRCGYCSKPKTAAMMSKRLPICRICENDLKSKGATAQNLFIARTLNNIHKKLKEAIV